VEILGHIFEQSISDLEEMHQQLTSAARFAGTNRPDEAKKEGAFYTPALSRVSSFARRWSWCCVTGSRRSAPNISRRDWHREARP